MLVTLTVVFGCQLAGELIVTALGAPLPGPVLGMAILFTGLVVNGGIPEDLAKVADGVLTNLSLLFVPAGAGIMLHLGLLGREAVPLLAATVVSTIATVAVTAAVMAALAPRDPAPDAPAPHHPGALDPAERPDV